MGGVVKKRLRTPVIEGTIWCSFVQSGHGIPWNGIRFVPCSIQKE